MENDVINSMIGGNVTMKCKVNLPIDHIVSLTWSKLGQGNLAENRTTITNVFVQGFSTLQISDVSLDDAGKYLCQAILRYGSDRNDHLVSAARYTVVDVSGK